MLIGLLSCCAFATQAFAESPVSNDYEFQQERMMLHSDAVFVISSFDSKDNVSAYTYYGIRLWSKTFHAKILSWQIANGYMFIFSKDRKGTSTYLTCLDIYTGDLIWERP